MTRLNKLFKVEFEGGGTGKEPKNWLPRLINRSYRTYENFFGI